MWALFEQHRKTVVPPGFGKDGPLPGARRFLASLIRSECLLDTDARREAWTLTTRALAMLSGFNSRQLHRITGRSYREEATTSSYDLLTAVRTRRHQWLGHILRIPADRLVRLRCWRWANQLDRHTSLAASWWTPVASRQGRQGRQSLGAPEWKGPPSRVLSFCVQ